MAPHPYPLTSFYMSSWMICLNSLFQMTRALIKKKLASFEGSCLSNTSFFQFGSALFFQALLTLRRPIWINNKKGVNYSYGHYSRHSPSSYFPDPTRFLKSLMGQEIASHVKRILLIWTVKVARAVCASWKVKPLRFSRLPLVIRVNWSSPFWTILAPSCFTVTSIAFFYLSKVLFSGFAQFERNSYWPK